MVRGNEGSFGDDFENEINLLLRDNRRQENDDFERELDLYRSGSAPPTVEGSLSAVGGLFNGGGPSIEFDLSRTGNGFSSDEGFRSDPAYLSYYYSKGNLNPRLPPPLRSREELRYAQRLKDGNSVLGGIGDRRNLNRGDGNSNGDRSMFPMPPGFESRKKENDAEWPGDGLPAIGLGSKQKSIADIIQDGFGHQSPVANHPSRPNSRNAFDNGIDAETELSHLLRESKSHTYAAAVGASLSRSTTPDPQVIARAPSPCPTPIGAGRANASEKRGVNSPSVIAGINGGSDIVSGFSGMSLSANNSRFEEDNRNGPESYNFGFQGGHDLINTHHPLLKKPESGQFEISSDTTNSSYRGEFQKTGVNYGNSYMKGSPTSTLNGGGGLQRRYPYPDSANSSYGNFGLGGSAGSGSYMANPPAASMMASQLGTGNLPPLLENLTAASALGPQGIDPRVYRAGLGSGPTDLVGSQIPVLQQQILDPMYLQYLRNSEYAAQLMALNDPSMDQILGDNGSRLNSFELQNGYLGQLLSSQKSHFGAPLSGKYGGSSQHGYYGAPYTGFPNSPVGPGSPIRHGKPSYSYNPRLRNFSGGFLESWQLNAGLDEGFGSSLLEEFKSNKARCFELSEITGHVVEFSGDQYGSRFIQQKLETATVEEKTMVYEEIMPHALVLMTDVFGNYVIQKFFEHGLPSQRRELAEKLLTNVSSLSLQMYGCRVIQKAIEVVDLDQKIEMVKELDGNVMRCVRDQNGNHVIQKCIECVPEENIQFIVTSFYNQIVNLSTHPYGCRVVQRILEHCKDPETQSKVMDEILSSVSMLAQDQYGNYVVQHVLEHGKPHERTIIIKELAGRIVQMSQQKFASNVVEKCVAFGDPSERQFLVTEMLGTTDENEPLQTMMKDQFGNYVVQKVLETCDDQMRELILSRIKVHLNALKKYTYGKHIVARVEKLVAAAERRMGMPYVNPSTVVI